MKWFIVTSFCLVCFLIACRSKVRTYENDLGVDPAVVAALDTAHYTTIQWIDTLKDFGKLKKGDSVFVSFRYKNTGDNTLFISEAMPSCGCTIANYPKKGLLPGESAELKATFDSRGYKGAVNKSVMVKTNTSNRMVQKLAFSGEVVDSLPVQR